MPRPSVSLPALGVAVAALALASCGGEDAKLLPGETAREITANLDTVKQLANEGDCVGAESAAAQVGEQVEELSGVDPKLKRALEEGAARLNEVITECEESTTEAIAPAEIPTEEEETSKKKQRQQQESKPKQEETTTTPEPETTPTTPTQPPSSPEEGESGGGEEREEAPSGGVSPAAPAGEGE